MGNRVLETIVWCGTWGAFLVWKLWEQHWCWKDCLLIWCYNFSEVLFCKFAWHHEVINNQLVEVTSVNLFDLREKSRGLMLFRLLFNGRFCLFLLKLERNWRKIIKILNTQRSVIVMLPIVFFLFLNWWPRVYQVLYWRSKLLFS